MDRATSQGGETLLFTPAWLCVWSDSPLVIVGTALAFRRSAYRLVAPLTRDAFLTHIALLILLAISRLFALLILRATLFILLHFRFGSLVLFFMT